MDIDIGFVMDPLESINPKKDSTIAMMRAAQRRGWRVWYFGPEDMFVRDGELRARRAAVTVSDETQRWYDVHEIVTRPVRELDLLLMRKDPPFDMEYIYATYLLEQAEREGVRVCNRPRALRDCNEKYATTWFPHCAPPTLVGREAEVFRDFLREQGSIVVKPLDGMGGASIFRIDQGDPNTNVILETLLRHGRSTAIAQRFLPEYAQGDKRILLIDGEPIPYALARIPAAGEARANLAVGGKGIGQPLSARDLWICAEIAPELRRRGLTFVGIDVIGDYLTEINVTSPTGIRELDAQFGLDIGGALMDALAAQLESPQPPHVKC
ncbi:MAG: glutathione synthase [Thiotrichales bacterium]